MQGRGSSHHPPSSSDQAAPTLGFYHFSRLSDLSFHSLMLIPEYLSITRAFLSLDSLSTWPLTLSPSSPSPPYVRACPPPPTPSSPPPPSGSKLSLNQSDHGTHTGHHVTQVISTLPLETSHHGLVLSSSPVSTWPGGRRQQNRGASPP